MNTRLPLSCLKLEGNFGGIFVSKLLAIVHLCTVTDFSIM